MEKFIGRFRCGDGGRMRRLDSSEEAFTAEMHEEPEADPQSEQPEGELTPMARFKLASERRHKIDQGEVSEGSTLAKHQRELRIQHNPQAGFLDASYQQQAMARFKQTSDRRHGIRCRGARR